MDATQLREAIGWVFELAEDDRPLVNAEGEQLYFVVEGTLEPVSEHVCAGGTDEIGELVDDGGGDGDPGEHHAGSVAQTSAQTSENGAA